MNPFKKTDSYPKFKILEDKDVVKLITAEIPPFDETTVNITRKREEWGLEAKPFVDTLVGNRDWVKAWDKAWFNFPLMYRDKPLGDAETMCPHTIRLLKQLGGINIAGFSLIQQNGRLKRHTDTTGPSNNSMALNQLLVGDNSSLYVSVGKRLYTHKHATGEIVIFNAENPHSADNRGSGDRVILYVDFISRVAD